MESACPKLNLALFRSTPRMEPARIARDLGSKLEIDPDRVIDPDKALSEGALIAMEWNNVRDENNPGILLANA